MTTSKKYSVGVPEPLDVVITSSSVSLGSTIISSSVTLPVTMVSSSAEVVIVDTASSVAGGDVTTTSSTIGNTTRLIVASTPTKKGVLIKISPLTPGDPFVSIGGSSGNGTLIDANGVPVAGAVITKDLLPILIPISDANLLYIAASQPSVDVVWMAL